MTTKLFEKAKVQDDGTIRGLDAHKGEELLLVKAPRIPVPDGKPREAADEIVRYLRAHRELAERQYEEFTARYGKPSDKVRELAGHLTPEELQRRTKELADFAEKRLTEVRKEVEAAYARVEKEIEARTEAVLGKSEKKTASNGAAAKVTLDEQAAAGSVENRGEREF